MFSLIQLESFVAVAEELHFGAAATRLNMTQPPLSRQIQLLEKELGAQLFVRSSRKVELTVAGQTLLPSARRILDLCTKTEMDVRKVSSGEAGTIVLGYTAIAGQSVLPWLLRLARQHMPGVSLVLREAVSADQLEALSRGAIDLGLLRPTVSRPGVRTELIFKDRLVVAMPEGHQLASGNGVRMKDLEGLPLMMYSTSEARYFYDLVLRLYESAGVRPTITQLASQVPALLAFAAADLGITLVPASAMDFAPQGVVAEELIGQASLAELNRADLHLAWNETGDNPAVQRLRQAILENVDRAGMPGEDRPLSGLD